MTGVKIGLALAAAIALCEPAQAQDEVPGYMCDLESGPHGANWFPTSLVVVAAGFKAVVHDTVLQRLTKAPAEAEVITNSDTHLVVRWRLPVAVQGNSTIITYRAAIDRRSRSVEVTAGGQGGPLKARGVGRCDLASDLHDPK